MVDIHINQVGIWALPLDLLARGVREVLADGEVGEGEISLTFLDDPGIRSLNREYFGKDGPTDVIAFALHSLEDSLLGDVYVGYEQAQRQAEDLSVPLEEELLRLAVHGTLHVLGHRHPEGEDREGSEMFQKQEDLLTQILSSS